MEIDTDYFLQNKTEFERKSREHECEVPKGDLWRIVVEHIKTKRMFEFYENDSYYDLDDQESDREISDGIQFLEIENE